MLTLNKRHAFPKKMYLCCGLSFRLRSRLNLSPDSNKRLQSSADILVLGKKRTQCIKTCAFRIPFQLHWQTTMAFFNRPVMARISFYRLSSQKLHTVLLAEFVCIPKIMPIIKLVFV